MKSSSARQDLGYQRPQALRLGNERAGVGDCTPGSSDLYCSQSGSSATVCGTHGNTAEECYTDGNSATLACGAYGSGA